MNKEALKKNLERLSYNYTDHGEYLTVRLPFALQLIIDWSDPNKIQLKEQLTSWNFLTGIISTSLKGALLYNFIGFLVIALLFIWLSGYINPTILLIILLVFIGWILLWGIFYVTKAESLKQQIINWIKE